MPDEGPSSEDLERFGGESACCPHCGAEVWDQAEVCPGCGDYLGGDTASRPRGMAWPRRRWGVVVAVIAVIALLAAILRLF